MEIYPQNLSITHFWEMKIYIMISNPEHMFIKNIISIKMPFSPDGKGHIRYY